jgi:hypothetical protein
MPSSLAGVVSSQPFCGLWQSMLARFGLGKPAMIHQMMTNPLKTTGKRQKNRNRFATKILWNLMFAQTSVVCKTTVVWMTTIIVDEQFSGAFSSEFKM